ncbi:MAG: hypothetical protein U9R75_11320 [Candidatus Thermoplasmatota archaeon]|nr:hypothetical protein [Candidatus Thermoplasmatota archaeon]
MTTATSKMTVTERMERAWLFIKFLMRLSKQNSARIKNIQEAKGFTRERVTRVHILDIGKHYDLKVKDGQFGRALVGKPEVFVYIKEFCTLKHLRLGTRLGQHPATGEMVSMPYSLLIAWSSGDISNHGEASTNDMFAFLDIFMEGMALIPPKDIIKLVGPCEHDTEGY